ncbi:MAG: hypothetical protein U0736_26990 [Gemmataceae bacterium]
MTVVGKILVFLNLVFSLVVGAFAVMDYTARTHWADAYAKVKAQNEVLRATSETYKKEADQLAQEKLRLYENLNTERVKWAPETKDDKDVGFRVAQAALEKLRSNSKTIDELKVRLEGLQKQLADERGKGATYRAMEAAYKSDVERRQADAGLLRQQIKDELDKNGKLVQETNQMRDDKVQAEILARTLKDRNSQLEEALRKVQVDLAQAKTLGGRSGMAAAGANPPPENLEGLVRRAEGNLVTISLGSDAGLARNQTMEVFRLGQLPKYIGRIRIVEVTPTQAVGQATGKLTTPIQVGDRVASRIVTNN